MSSPKDRERRRDVLDQHRHRAGLEIDRLTDKRAALTVELAHLDAAIIEKRAAISALSALIESDHTPTER